MSARSPFIESLRLGCSRLVSRKIYLFGIVLVPLLGAVFFTSLLSPGLPVKVPTAVVDLDHSAMSRSMTRSLDAQELIDVQLRAESFAEAMAAVREGKIFGFYVIPANFETDALAGRRPTLNYYSNMTYFVPGTFTYKGFKTIAVTTAAAVVSQQAAEMGLPADVVGPLVQPVDLQINEIGNPWTNYAYYLGPSFTYGVVQLMVLLMTIFSITVEIKNYTSRRWLAAGGGSILVAVAGKLLPQTAIFTLVGWACMAIQFGFAHFPVYGSIAALLLGMFLMVVASQGLGLLIASVLPNPRLALSVGALIGILAFSVAGFSFPVPSMYGAIGIFAYILPVRWFFLIYATCGLNGAHIWFARMDFVALLIFIPASLTMLWRLKKACLNPVYVP